ncbi:hypothetical protein EPH_0014550 [Eimeria praecox]|uniref:Uncharacterized protein n=1 Tax=Eimeria praecox TaxID=51316 RepID=U6H127_9EIME|nr:hypothetical protein EPH_0014550 [Eimeria praecox]
MPERHNFLQDNAAPNTVPALASSELPTVGSIFARPGSLRPAATRSAPCLRAAVAALASVAAITVLIFFCSRVYKRRAVQSLRSRRLANSEDSSAPADVCGNDGNAEEQEHAEVQQRSSPSEREERGVPLKKRLSARGSEAGIDGERHTPRYQQEMQHDHETMAGPSVSYTTTAASSPDQLGYSPYLFRSQVSSAQMGYPMQQDTAALLMNLQPRVYGDYPLTVRDGQTILLAIRQLQKQVRRVERKVNRLQRQLEGRRQTGQRQQAHVRLQRDEQEVYQEQQQRSLYLQHLQWQRQQQQLYLLQQQHQQHLVQLAEQYRLMQQQQQQQELLPAEENGHVGEDRERDQQPMQEQEQEQQAKQQEEIQQPAKKKQKLKHLEDPEPVAKEQEQVHERHPLSGHLLNEWVEQSHPESVSPQPSTSQEALRSSAAAAAAAAAAEAAAAAAAEADAEAAIGPSTSKDIKTQATPGQSAAPASTADLAAAASTDDPAGPPGPAAGSGAAEVEGAEGGPSSAASAKQETVQLPTLSSLLGHPRPALPRPAFVTFVQQEEPGSGVGDQDDHPFCRLPKVMVKQIPNPLMIDFRRAVTAGLGRRNPMPLLHKIQQVMGMDGLYLSHIKELSDAVTELIGHAMYHQKLDVSKYENFRAAEKLGVRFLVMDAVVSTLILLDQRVDAGLWKTFIDSISDVLPSQTPRGNYAGKPAFYTSLVRELGNAIKLLKSGQRPIRAELVKIKQMLICNPLSPARFRERDFTPWRRAAGCFSNGQ